MSDQHNIVPGLLSTVANMRETAAEWLSDGFDTGDVIGTITDFANDLDKAIAGQTATTPAYAVALAIVSVPVGLPSLEALGGMILSINDDQAAHYVVGRTLIAFMTRYGSIDAAEAASSEEGEAFGKALELADAMSLTEALRFDPTREDAIRAEMVEAA